jgi:chromosome segregation protein
LQTKRRFLDRELAWAEVERRESILKGLQVDRQEEQKNLNEIEAEAKTTSNQLESQGSLQETLKDESKTILSERFSFERGIAENEITLSLVEQLLKEASMLKPEIQKRASQFKLLRSENLHEIAENSRQNLSKITEKVKENQLKMQSIHEAGEKITNQVLNNRVQLALLQYRRESVAADLKKISAAVLDAKANLEGAVARAEEAGARIAVLKTTADILDEIRVTDGHLAALADVSENIERMYESYSKLYLELKDKAQAVAENREKTLEEVKIRMQTWRNVMQSLLERVNLEYQRIMSQTLASGEVRLANGHDIETAGLEILVGFNGGKPVPLDAYTQSGGERTTATMSFLLALQQHVRSPFRAVDEYDIHMDPKNREMIARMLLSMIKDSTSQYIVITPSQITFAQQNANIITVQNIQGESIVQEVL